LDSLYPADNLKKKRNPPRSFKNHRGIWGTISQLRITIAQCADAFC